MSGCLEHCPSTGRLRNPCWRCKPLRGKLSVQLDGSKPTLNAARVNSKRYMPRLRRVEKSGERGEGLGIEDASTTSYRTVSYTRSPLDHRFTTYLRSGSYLPNCTRTHIHEHVGMHHTRRTNAPDDARRAILALLLSLSGQAATRSLRLPIN